MSATQATFEVQTSAAKSQLLKEIKAISNNGFSPQSHSPPQETESETVEPESLEPPTKMFRHLNKPALFYVAATCFTVACSATLVGAYEVSI